MQTDGGNGISYEAGPQFYDDLSDELYKYNIEPVITLSHFEMPLFIIKTDSVPSAG